MRILFIGDSVTEAGRRASDPDDLGTGWPALAAARLGGPHRFLNRGVGGDRIRDLAARWQPDCLDLRPDVVTVLIGINDTWRRYDQGEPIGTEEFAAVYADLL